MILRLNPPGQPIAYIDLGPARARITGYVSANIVPTGSIGGPVQSDLSRTNAQHQRAFRDRSLADTESRCGLVMPKGGVCIERQGHLSHCRTAKK